MERQLILLLHVLLLVGRHVLGDYEDDADRPVTVEDIHVLSGDSVELACDVSEEKLPAKAAGAESSDPDQWGSYAKTTWLDEDDNQASREHDRHTQYGSFLVLWFVDPDRKPIYSFDVRGRPPSLGRHSWDKRRFDNRAHLFLSPDSTVSRLRIANVTSADAGVYRCRVDHKNAPTRNIKYRLVVIEPPNEVMILDNALQQLSSTVGPLNDGSDLILTCRAIRGNPSPTVTWWHNGQLIDNTTDFRATNIVSNRLVFQRVSRHNVDDTFTCQVSSSPLLRPITKTISLHLLLQPLYAEIAGPRKPVVANHSSEFRCTTSGSKPPAVLTWWIGNSQIYDRVATVNSEDGNTTLSILTLVPKYQDDGQLLYCRAANPSLSGSAQEDFVRLDVQYSPIVGLALGTNINGHHIKEADDLYLECHIQSNPTYHRLSWTHNGVAVQHNISAGIIFSNVSLVLQSVARQRAGNYTCTAVNSRGETSSAPLFLKVHYSPRCKNSGEVVVGVTKLESVSLRCQVDGDPAQVQFWWSFLGTPVKLRNASSLLANADTLLLPKDQYTSHGTTSVLNYTAKTELDYGVVACWASNSIGTQRDPCLFRLIPTGKPKAPSNCTIRNRTADFLRVECREASSGGLQQTFGLEVIDLETREIRLSMNNSKPSFEVYGLEPESAFLLSIFAVNTKGRSEEIGLEAVTLKATEKQRGLTGYVPGFQLSPLLAVVTGTALTLIVVVITVAAIVHKRRKELRRHNNTGGKQCDRSASVERTQSCARDNETPTRATGTCQIYSHSPNLQEQPDLLSRQIPSESLETSLVDANFHGLRGFDRYHGDPTKTRLPESFL